jgi:DNA invertase Pin-like site-specific DNA recombinase
MLKTKQARAIVVARLDRLARSTQHLCEYITLCKKQKWSMVALDVGLDTTSANGRFMVRVLAAVAEWESEVNGERVREGMAEARANGKVFGFQSQTPPEVAARIIRARAKGQPFAVIAKRLDKANISTPGGGARWYASTVARIYNSATKQAAAS